MIDERALLRIHIQRALDDVAVALASLGLKEFSDRQRKAVSDRFETRLHSHRTDLTKIAKAFDKGELRAEMWRQLRSVRNAAEQTIQESLAFVEGMLIRAAKVDDGMCDLSDHLLHELSAKTKSKVTWSNVTILADAESFYHVADIIRIRYPSFSVWSLPVVAHEFGHLVSRDLRDLDAEGTRYCYPFLRVLDKNKGRSEGFLREDFADFFGVYALGPAFAAAIILVSFEPLDADRPDHRHPATNERVALILRALRRLDAAFDPVANALDGAWAAAQARLDVAVPAVGLEQPDDEFWELVETFLPWCRYQGWSRAQELAAAYIRNETVDAIGADLIEISDIADALNAAWLVRFQRWAEFDSLRPSLERWTANLCSGIVEARPRKHG